MSVRKVLFGLLLILLGLVLLGNSLDIFSFDLGDAFSALLPLGLIILGLWMIARRRREGLKNIHVHVETDRSHPPNYDRWHGFTEQTASTGTASGPEQTSSADPMTPGRREPGKYQFRKSFGDLFVDCAGVNMQNVEVSLFVGACDIRLKNAILNNGLNRLIISSFVGDVLVLVPSDMAVLVHCTNFIGDVRVFERTASGITNSLDLQTANYETAEKRLYIAANTFIGDMKIIQH